MAKHPHTPGPWVYDPNLGYVRNPDDWPVGEMGETGLAIEDEHARIAGDRRIIAASLDMLAALRLCLRALEPDAHNVEAAFTAARAAKARAEGG